MPQSVRDEPAPRHSALEWLVLAVILAVTCAAYYPALHGGLLWDDDAHVTRPGMRDWRGLYYIWFELGATQQYYPLLHTSFWIQNQLWGYEAPGYHLVNLALHLAAVCLVYAVLRKLRIPGALLAAAIFAVHPVQVETVAWITEQKNTLSAVFYLGGMLAYLYFDETRRRSWYGLALGLFVLGLLSKTVTATLPAAVLVIFWWQRGTLSWQRDVKPLLPFFALGAAAGLFTAWVEHHLIGAQGAAFSLSPADRFVLAGRVIWFYVMKLIWPANLMFIYPRWQIDASQPWQWSFLLLAVAALAVALAVRGRWRAPLAGGLLFVGTLFPVLGFFNVYPFLFSFVADHFQYLACLGLIVPVAAAVALAVSRFPIQGQIASGAAAVAVVVGLAYLSWERSFVYVDGETLYTTTIAQNPECWMAYTNLGKIVAEKQGEEAGLEYFRKALSINPQDTNARYNLAMSLRHLGREDEAIRELGRAAELAPRDPDVLTKLGETLADKKMADAVVAQFEAAVRLYPQNFSVRSSYAKSLFKLGRFPAAVEQYEAALKIRPDDVEALTESSLALLAVGKSQDALNRVDRALTQRPDDAAAQNTRGVVLLNRNDPQGAVAAFTEATRLKPTFSEAWANLGLANERLNRTAEAIAASQTALELARRQGETALAQQIEAWLSAHTGEKPPAQTPGPALPP